jgi:hypothetical protein
MKVFILFSLFVSTAFAVEIKSEKTEGLRRFRAPSSIVDREFQAQRAERNIEKPVLDKDPTPKLNPASEVPERLRVITPGSTRD